jgi:hypothetical protein
MVMTEQHNWPLEQASKGMLRPWHLTAVGYVVVLFEDPKEAERAERDLRESGIPQQDLRLYDATESLGIVSRLKEERSNQSARGSSGRSSSRSPSLQ